jgi:hypothetical protein
VPAGSAQKRAVRRALDYLERRADVRDGFVQVLRRADPDVCPRDAHTPHGPAHTWQQSHGHSCVRARAQMSAAKLVRLLSTAQVQVTVNGDWSRAEEAHSAGYSDACLTDNIIRMNPAVTAPSRPPPSPPPSRSHLHTCVLTACMRACAYAYACVCVRMRAVDPRPDWAACA